MFVSLAPPPVALVRGEGHIPFDREDPMPQEDLSDRLLALKRSLEEIEQALTESNSPQAGLEDFKMAVDHVRLSTWAILAARQSEDQQELIARFRLGRVAEICRHVVADIDAGSITAGTPDLDRIHTTMDDTVNALGRLMRGGT